MQDRLQSILLELVTRERSGDVIDRSLMRSITMVGHAGYSRWSPRLMLAASTHGACGNPLPWDVLLQMLVDLGMDVYQDEFERSFLQTAAEAYQVWHRIRDPECLATASMSSCLHR